MVAALDHEWFGYSTFRTLSIYERIQTLFAIYVGYNYLQSKTMAMPTATDTKKAKSGLIFGEEQTLALSIASLKICGSYSISINI